MKISALLSATLYSASLIALALLSAHALGAAGTCQDVAALSHLHARTSTGISLPIPVIQMCSGYTLPLLLIGLTILASIAWLGVRRWTPPAWMLAACMGIGLITSLAFPYFATTDPYAYALYGYRANHGESPYAESVNRAQANSKALNQLYTFFPPGSDDRVANYGPLAMLQYQTAAFAGGGSLRGFLIVTRAFNAFLLILLAWLLMQLRPPQSGRLSSAFVAFHPLLLIESIAFAHGDLLMMVLLCAAWVAYRRDRVALCAVLIVLATEVRAAAGLALVVLLLQAAGRRDMGTLLRAVYASAATAAVTVAASFCAYGTFTLGGTPALALFSSPFAVLFDAFGLTMPHVAMGAEMQALMGIVLILLLLCAKRYSYLPLAAYTGLPVLRAWYCQWLIPQIAVDPNSRAAYAANALACIAIVAEWPEMTGDSRVTTWLVILALQWLLPIAALYWGRLRLRGSSDRALFASQRIRAAER